MIDVVTRHNANLYSEALQQMFKLRHALLVEERGWEDLRKTDDEIATILAIRSTTAHWHVENAKRKLDVATRIQAVIAAYRAGDLSI